MRNSGTSGMKKWQRRASAVAVSAVIAALAGTVAAGDPARGATVRPTAVPADRAYPVLVTGQNSAGDSYLTEIGPSWEVTLKLPSSYFGPGGVSITPNGKYAYVAVGNAIALISGVDTAHPKITSTFKPGGQVGGITLTRNGAYAYATVTTGTYPNTTGVVRAYSGVSVGKPRLVTSLSLGKESPGSIALTPSGGYGYIFSSSLVWPAILQQISGIGTAHLKVNWTDDEAGTRASEVWGVTQNGKYVYVAGGPSAYGSINIFKTGTAKPVQVKSFGFSAGPSLLLAPNGRWAYAGLVFLNGTYKIQVISGAQTTPKLAGTVKLPHDALPEAIQPDGTYGYAEGWSLTDFGKPSWVVVFSGASTGHVTAVTSWKLPYQPTSIDVSPAKA